MEQSSPTEITELLGRVGAGDRAAEERLAELTYEELRATAQRLMRHEQNHTLQPTALVNEAYLRLTRDEALGKSPDRAYFFAAAAQAMRRILVEAARRRRSQKAGGHLERQPLDDMLVSFEDRSIDLVALDAALSELQELNSRHYQVVQMRWFIGLTVKEIAELLEISVSTVESDWRIARAFLFKRISEEP